jgi:hypothetical protein
MIIAPTSSLQTRRCARCSGGRERQDVWVVALEGRLVLHADCAEGLLGDLEADLRSALWLAKEDRCA